MTTNKGTAMDKKNNSIKNVLDNKLVVEDFSGATYVLYSVDVCCGKALLISTSDNRLSIRAITDLRCVSGQTYDLL